MTVTMVSEHLLVTDGFHNGVKYSLRISKKLINLTFFAT